jgi:hypothetical protein
VTRRFCLAFVVVLALLGSARAQQEDAFSTYWGVRIGLGVNTVPLVPHFGIHFGAEGTWGSLFAGARASGSSLFFLMWYGALDVYGGSILESGWRVYTGGGVGALVFLAIGADGGLFTNFDVHALIGTRSPYGLFLEARPGVMFFERCSDPAVQFQLCSSKEMYGVVFVDFVIGWIFRF